MYLEIELLPVAFCGDPLLILFLNDPNRSNPFSVLLFRALALSLYLNLFLTTRGEELLLNATCHYSISVL